MRNWEGKDGNRYDAEIISVDETNEKLTLRLSGEKETTLSFSDLSVRDKAWILEWIEMNEELAEKVKEYGGRLERIDDKEGKGRAGFYVYHPSGVVDATKPRPLMFIFDPSGNPIRYILRHIEAAEKTKITLASSETFRNGQNTADTSKKFDAILTLFESNVPYDKNRLFLGGTSGGAVAAFATSADLPHVKFAGIYSNVGWLGPAPHDKRPYPAYRVAMVNGDKDHAVADYLDSVTKTLQDRGCTISLFAFEGAHQIPPPSVQIKSFRWLLGETE
jgi:dienelactone hydrolase